MNQYKSVALSGLFLLSNLSYTCEPEASVYDPATIAYASIKPVEPLLDRYWHAEEVNAEDIAWLARNHPEHLQELMKLESIALREKQIVLKKVTPLLSRFLTQRICHCHNAVRYDETRIIILWNAWNGVRWYTFPDPTDGNIVELYEVQKGDMGYIHYETRSKPSIRWEMLDEIQKWFRPKKLTIAQCALLEAFDRALKDKARIHANAQQWRTFKTFPESVRTALQPYIAKKKSIHKVKVRKK